MSEAEYDLTYVSLGAGVQSTALLVCSALGLHDVPRASVAIFADTGGEPERVYDHLGRLTEWAAEHGIDVRRVSVGDLARDYLERDTGRNFAAIPAYTMGARRRVILRRQCTREYKVLPIEKEVRRLLGFRKGQKITVRRAQPGGGFRMVPRKVARCMLGISVDELQRMRTSTHRWIVNAYPLVDARLRREDCSALLERHGFAEVGRSACVFCPFHTDPEWDRMKREDPESFEQACEFDRAIRQLDPGVRGGEVFLHSSLRPLEDVAFSDERQGGLFDGFAGECEGLCGV